VAGRADEQETLSDPESALRFLRHQLPQLGFAMGAQGNDVLVPDTGDSTHGISSGAQATIDPSTIDREEPNDILSLEIGPFMDRRPPTDTVHHALDGP
jgi:hypothetical protein